MSTKGSSLILYRPGAVVLGEVLVALGLRRAAVLLGRVRDREKVLPGRSRRGPVRWRDAPVELRDAVEFGAVEFGAVEFAEPVELGDVRLDRGP